MQSAARDGESAGPSGVSGGSSTLASTTISSTLEP
jgi:hypothetical protein